MTFCPRAGKLHGFRKTTSGSQAGRTGSFWVLLSISGRDKRAAFRLQQPRGSCRYCISLASPLPVL
jgi:hypothetical protein